jgi:hypothetical protein
MSTWKKLIVSGSNAHVESTTISGAEGSHAASLQVDTGKVLFTNLPAQTGIETLPEGSLMKSGTENYVMVKVIPAVPPTHKIIPYNTANLDYNGDGAITTADLLAFLSVFGTPVDSVFAASFDANMNGHMDTGDLLEFLANFGLSSIDWADTRPVIDWCSIPEWKDSTNRVTPASVTAYFDAVEAAGGDIWQILPHGGSVSNNVYNYINQTMTPSLETFLYIYFGQSTGGIWGGHDIYNRDYYDCTPYPTHDHGGNLIHIPFNVANLDFNGDGIFTTSDLLHFMSSLWGLENITTAQEAMGDTNMDGGIQMQDLLKFLQWYSKSYSSEWIDTRPVIDWCSITGWIDGNGNITPASVTAYFDAVEAAGGDIWQILPHGDEVDSDGSPVDNVYNYINQTMTPSAQTFRYIYFEQSTNGVWGGNDIYHRDSISCS